MSKGHYLVLSFAGLLFLLLYFGFDTKPEAQKEVERVRTLTTESTDINSLLLTAKKNLKPEDASEILLAESKLSEANKNETDKTEAFKALSSAWYKINRFAIAGYYAQQVAEVESSDLAWSIAGATFNRGMNLETEEKVKDYCSNRAIQAFENAVSLNPSDVNHKANLAVCYAERPPKDNPMKGVKMLLDLNKQNPDNVAVLSSLGRFGLQTGQYEKAAGRLEKALLIAPDNIKVTCLLAQAYEGLGQAEKAKTFQDKCQSLASAQR